MASLIIADDDAVVRTGVRMIVERETDLQVVAEAGSGAEAITLTEALCPDVLVLDLSLPDVHGLEVVRHVRLHCPRTRTVILSMYSSESYVLEALNAGASAYVLKESAVSDLVNAIRTVMAGSRYLSHPLLEAKLRAYAARAATQPTYESLSPRERQVLRLAAEGHTNARIAELLGIGPAHR